MPIEINKEEIIVEINDQFKGMKDNKGNIVLAQFMTANALKYTYYEIIYIKDNDQDYKQKIKDYSNNIAYSNLYFNTDRLGHEFFEECKQIYLNALGRIE